MVVQRLRLLFKPGLVELESADVPVNGLYKIPHPYPLLLQQQVTLLCCAPWQASYTAPGSG